MDRLTRPEIPVDLSCDRFIHPQFSCKPDELSDKVFHLILNGPTINGVTKDTLRVLLRMLYSQMKSLEDILGPTYDLDRLRELVVADKAGRIDILPCALGVTVYEVVQLPNREALLLGVPRKIQFGRETTRAAWLPWGVREKKMSKSMYSRWGRSVFPDKDTADETAAMWNQNDEDRRRKINEPQF